MEISKMDKNWKIETMAIQAGYEPKDGEPRVMPIVQSTTFKYDNAQCVADLFDLKREGFFYTRLANPTVDAFEKKIAAMEGGVAAVALAAGQTATMLSILNVCPAGYHVVASGALYGGTVTLFSERIKKMGVTVDYVPANATKEEIIAASNDKTRAIFIEVLTNPSLTVTDFEQFSAAAKELGVPLIADNTFPSPYLCNPLEHGADFVVHSATKYIDGHAVTLGGVVVEKGGFNWNNGKFPEFTEPDPAITV